MDPPNEEDEQVLIPEIHAEMCHETRSLDKNVGDDVPAYVHPRMSIYAGGDNEVVDNEDQRVIDEQVLALQKKLDKGKGIFNADEGKLKRKNIKSRSKGNGIVIRENDDPSYGDNCDSDSDSEMDQENDFYRFDESDREDSLKSYDYLSDGEDEVKQLRKRMYEFKSGGEVAEEEQGEPNKNAQNPPSQDEEFATPLRMFDMGISGTVKEHEQDMNILMRRIKAKGNDLKDPFHLVDKTERYPLYDETTHWKLKKPKLGEKFVTVEQFKECLTYYALANGFSLWCHRSSTQEVIAKCGHRKEVIKDPSKGKQRAYKKFPTKDPNQASSHSICPWRCYAKKLKVDGSFQVISLKDEHTCVKNFNYGTLINYKWLRKHFGYKIRANPKITLHALADLVMKKYSCIVSPNQCRRAKEYALSEGECSLQDHYGMLWSYARALLDSNEGSTVRVGVTVNPDEKTYFDRFYVCLHGLKEGWKLGCRKIIALDGCFLKKPNSGEILTAVGRDGNNQIYPVAWAIVNVENKENWCWFLSLLGEDLEFPDGSGLTLMSDQHKGLIEAVKQVMPYAEHRQCARHIYEGFRKQFSGIEFKLLFWAASKASYPQLFTKIMENIKRANPKAHEYLSKKDSQTWSRAFFREGINCEAVENGFSECFNAVLVGLRHKPIITLLESMRVLVMERMHTMRLIVEKWKGEICPRIQAILEHTKDQQKFWHVTPAGNSKFEVRKGYDAFTVDEAANTCSCRMWQISGLPCVHAVACIFKLNKLVEPYVPSCFNIDTFGLAYNQFVKPVEGITFWPDCSNLSRILGPIPKKMPGRPKKKRIRASHENKSSTKISRAGIPMTCQNCGELGHNRKGCKNPTIPKPPKEKGKAGRPKNIVPTENENEVHDDDTPRFVNTSISEFVKAPSKNFLVSNDGINVNLGMNLNKYKRGGKSASSYFVKMRGGKSSRGGLVPAERLGKIDRWLVVDGASSDAIEDTRAFQSSHVATKSNQNDAGIIIETQQSQVVGGVARMKGNVIEAQIPNSSPSTPIGVKMSRGKQSKTRYITNTSSSSAPVQDKHSVNQQLSTRQIIKQHQLLKKHHNSEEDDRHKFFHKEKEAKGFF